MAINFISYISSQEYIFNVVVEHSSNLSVKINIGGLYDLQYIQNGVEIHVTGKIRGVYRNQQSVGNSYITFDSSDNMNNASQRIYLYQIKYIQNITPNNAYQMALDNGFEGTLEDWFNYMKGPQGEKGDKGDTGPAGPQGEKGDTGRSAYQIALDNGFKGTEKEWLKSLEGITPHIGENGNWFLGEIDTGVTAAPDLGGYFSEQILIALTQNEILEICN